MFHEYESYFHESYLQGEGSIEEDKDLSLNCQLCLFLIKSLYPIPVSPFLVSLNSSMSENPLESIPDTVCKNVRLRKGKVFSRKKICASP